MEFGDKTGDHTVLRIAEGLYEVQVLLKVRSEVEDDEVRIPFCEHEDE